jgi:hypothetical protein
VLGTIWRLWSEKSEGKQQKLNDQTLKLKGNEVKTVRLNKRKNVYWVSSCFIHIMPLVYWQFS